MTPTRRQLAAYRAGKCEEHVTPEDIRNWTGEGVQQFRADPNGYSHAWTCSADEWKRCASFFREREDMSEAEALEYVEEFWRLATLHMNWQGFFDMMHEAWRDSPLGAPAPDPSVRCRGVIRGPGERPPCLLKENGIALPERN